MKSIKFLTVILALSSFLLGCKKETSSEIDASLLINSWTTTLIIENNIDVTSSKGTATLDIPTGPGGSCHIFIPGSMNSTVLWDLYDNNKFRYFDGSGANFMTITRLTTHELHLTSNNGNFVWELES